MKPALFNIILLLIFNLSCQNNSSPLAKIDVKETVHDFGELKYNDSIFVQFSIRNKSSIPLKIYKVGTSCGCTTVQFTKSEIREGEIGILYRPNSTGMDEKSIE